MNMNGFKLKPFNVQPIVIAWLLVFSAIASFFIFWMWHWYGCILPCSTLLTTLLCLSSYKQCCTQLLKVLHKCCNTDIRNRGFTNIFTLSLDHFIPLWSCIYIYKLKPHCHVTTYRCTYVCTYIRSYIQYIHMHVCMYSGTPLRRTPLGK